MPSAYAEEPRPPEPVEDPGIGMSEHSPDGGPQMTAAVRPTGMPCGQRCAKPCSVTRACCSWVKTWEVRWHLRGEQGSARRVRTRPHPRHTAVRAGVHGRRYRRGTRGPSPIVEMMTVNFSLLALDQMMNTAAALRHMSGGQFLCRW